MARPPRVGRAPIYQADRSSFRQSLSLANDVPIRNMARGIEIGIRQMLDETDLPPPIGAIEGTNIVIEYGVRSAST